MEGWQILAVIVLGLILFYGIGNNNGKSGSNRGGNSSSGGTPPTN